MSGVVPQRVRHEGRAAAVAGRAALGGLLLCAGGLRTKTTAFNTHLAHTCAWTVGTDGDAVKYSTSHGSFVNLLVNRLLARETRSTTHNDNFYKFYE